VSTIEIAFQNLGYKPSKSERAMMTHNREIIRLADFNRVFEAEVVEHCVKPRKVQVQRAGGIYKARYHGEQTFVLGDSPADVISRLRTWAGKP
jgi:hypothetical protein